MKANRLFRVTDDLVSEVRPDANTADGTLWRLFRANAEAFIGLRALKNFYGVPVAERVDLLGIDNRYAPVMVRLGSRDDGLTIRDSDSLFRSFQSHRREFELLVAQQISSKVAIESGNFEPRIMYLAQNFTESDFYDASLHQGQVELIRCTILEGGLVDLEQVHSRTNSQSGPSKPAPSDQGTRLRTVEESLQEADSQLRYLWDRLMEFLHCLGPNVREKTTKYYVGFRRIKQFACVQIKANKRVIIVSVNVDPCKLNLVPGFTRDIRHVGHIGTGSLEITICDYESLESAKDLISQSFRKQDYIDPICHRFGAFKAS